MNLPEDLKNHDFKLHEAKIFRPKYHTVSRELLGWMEISFFLPSTTDTIEDIMNSVNLIPFDINQKEFEVDGGDFDPLRLDFDNRDRQKTRESILRVLKKVVDLSNSNFQKNADDMLATKPYNKNILWVGDSEKCVPENKFALIK